MYAVSVDSAPTTLLPDADRFGYKVSQKCTIVSAAYPCDVGIVSQAGCPPGARPSLLTVYVLYV